MTAKPSGSLKVVDDFEKQLADDIGSFHDDPYGFVLYAYEWGKGELTGEAGPDDWQTEFLQRVRDELKLRKETNIDTALRAATASGHGVGKTALVAWLIHWFMSTRPKCQVVVTANTQIQLTTKTWRELSKWSRLSINRHWFVWTATKYYHTLFPEIWCATAVPWSKDNSEAFAGTHETSGVAFFFDEGSSIDDVIWDVGEGAMTTSGSMWFVFGNPTRTSGKFYECFHSMKHRWITYQVDSRKAKMANKKQIEEWIEDYGEDSDFVKVRVKGEFPRQSANQFIGADIVLEASQRPRDPRHYAHHPVIFGVDVARFGGDESVIIKRQAYIVDPPITFKKLDVMELAGRVVEIFRKYPNSIICVDGAGLGGGLVDRLKQLGLPYIDVQSAAKAWDPRTYANKRAELWGRMKDWLIAGGCLPKDKELLDQIPAIEYGFNKRLQILLESKEDIRKKGGISPDRADALAFTFAYDEVRMRTTNAKARNIRRVTWI